MEKLTKLRKTVLTESNGHEHFGYEIVCYEDVTSITYFEKNEKKEITRQETFTITTGYDLEVFKEAIRLREEEINGS